MLTTLFGRPIRSAIHSCLGGALAASLLLGCGSRYGDYCESVAQCGGGNDADIDACVAQVNSAEAIAAAYDCSDRFDTLVDCTERTGNCDSKSYTSNCNDETEALSRCIDAASARGGGSSSPGSSSGGQDSSSSGGGPAPQCSDLQAVCDSCADQAYVESCQSVVNFGDNATCSQSLDTFTSACAQPG